MLGTFLLPSRQDQHAELLPLLPDWPFHPVRATTSIDRRFKTFQSSSTNGYKCSEIVKGTLGYFWYSQLSHDTTSPCDHSCDGLRNILKKQELKQDFVK